MAEGEIWSQNVSRFVQGWTGFYVCPEATSDDSLEFKFCNN